MTITHDSSNPDALRKVNAQLRYYMHIDADGRGMDGEAGAACRYKEEGKRREMINEKHLQSHQEDRWICTYLWICPCICP
ncbi:MAG: hypothetical protein MJZ85_10975 [Bacteroidales bacterium]|nr:hypothetical protein [Bacteroidales bacterium]